MSSGVKTIDIIMACYNGEAYISEQLRSIAECDGFEEHVREVLVLDDGSTDATIGQVEKHRDLLLGKLKLHSNADRLGPCGNFARGMSLSEAPYVMFSDQDDVWHKNKIERQFKAMSEMEKEYGPSQPMACFCDMRIVDANLAKISSSFYSYQGLKPLKGLSPHCLALQNMAPGCSMIVNRALMDKALPIVNEAVMHDWWLALVARCFGKLAYLPEALQDYRQHSANALGAQPFVLSLGRYRESIANIQRDLKQLKAFVGRYSESEGTVLTPTQWQRLRMLADLDKASLLKRLWAFSSGQCKKSPGMQNMALAMVLARLKPVKD